MNSFEFHSELIELRSIVISLLSDQGFDLLADYGAIDLDHDIYGLEVTMVHNQKDAKSIESLLRRFLPDWRHSCTFYEDQNAGEIGWKVIISRSHEKCDNVSLSSPRIAPQFGITKPWYLKIAVASAFGLIIAIASVLISLVSKPLSLKEIIATLILLPVAFGIAATILIAIDKFRSQTRLL